MKTAISLTFADGQYLFRLPIKRIVAIEERAGPIDLVRHRLLNGGFSIHDVVETIRQGLIGGGSGEVDGVNITVSDLKANSLIENYVEDRPLAASHLVARAIIGALYVGYEPEDGQKKKRRGDDERVEPKRIDWGLILFNCITLGLTYADAENITMPEYLALSHYHERAQKSGGDAGKEWTSDELNDAFIRAERSGALRIN